MKVLVSFGTRPELIKMFPLVNRLKKCPDIQVSVLNTGQHKEMLGNLLSFFDIKIDYELSTLQPGQSLTELTSKIALGVDKVLAESHFDLVFVHGDTTTSMAVSLAAFYRKVKVAHVEAGLRTYNLHAPWPEEMNRRFNSLIADYHFAPTETAKQNLLSEHIPASKISVTGNTVIDALLWVKEKIKTSNLQQEFDLKWPFSSEKFLLVTCHRRENHKDGIRRLCRALKRIVEQKDVKIVFPVHLNPEIRKVVHAELKSHPGIHLLEPLDYPEFVYFMSKSYLILSDSGGVQEEAPSLGVPVLVLREVTERPEAVAAGAVQVIGMSEDAIFNSVSHLLEDTELYTRMSKAKNPYGDGSAAENILSVIL